MATINGSIHDSFSPVSTTQSALDLSYNNRSNYLVSANVPKRYQVRWEGAGVNESYTPTKTAGTLTTGDIVNMVFYVYGTTQYVDGAYPASLNNWDLVAKIKKSRDLANKKYNNDGSILNNQRFTVDISQLCQDILSYSLVPIGKGTWQSSLWGGMNGGQTKQDNVTQSVSEYNVTPNGTYRHIRVVAKPEIILSNGLITEATNTVTFNDIAVINSVGQFERDSIFYYNQYTIQKSPANSSNPRGFLSFCPNFTQASSVALRKNVRTDDEAEWLYWWQRNMGETADQTTKARLKVETFTSNGSAQNTMYLSDFNSNLDTETVSGLEVFRVNQKKMCVQNVSPSFINANAQDDGGNTLTNQIDSSTSYYRTHLEYVNAEDNIIINGTFDTDTDWGKGTGWSINTTTKIAECDGSQSAGTQLTQTGLSFTNGVTYKVTYTLTVSAGSVKAAFRGGTSVDGASRTTSGTYTENLVALTGNNSFRMIANTDFIGTVDNISVQANPTTVRATEYRYYNIDREDAKLPYDFVRFHWLNRMGGIDSYTAKRSVVESISVNRDTIENKSSDRTWYQNSLDGTGATIADADYISNTMRGGNLYKGGREVLNVNANRNNSVYTEPLNKSTAQWLEEIMTSPNVWIEMDTDATARGNTINPYQRPSTKEYIPVIITNGSAETVNQEAGLVSFNIEYTLAHKVQTQRN
tara:strand:- start:1075 stop:3162 length:2088 start_codon:yes stop_codon:yes gene_type:complete